MVVLLTVIILLACVVLGFFILIQNPEGGGLSGTFGSIGSQVMGVRKSNNMMEKGTWATIGIIAGLCIISVIFFEKPKTADDLGNVPHKTSAPAATPAPMKAPAPKGK